MKFSRSWKIIVKALIRRACVCIIGPQVEQSQKDIFNLYLKLILSTLAAANGNIAQLNKETPNSNNIEVCISKPSIPRRAASAPKIKVGI